MNGINLRNRSKNESTYPVHRRVPTFPSLLYCILKGTPTNDATLADSDSDPDSVLRIESGSVLQNVPIYFREFTI